MAPASGQPMAANSSLQRKTSETPYIPNAALSISLSIMPATFSNEEYADILFVYGFCNGNASAAAREYRRRYPNRRCPDTRVFYSVYQHIRDTGSVPGVNATADRANPQDKDREIMEAVANSPGTSTRRLAQRLNVSHQTVWRTLKWQGLKPFHLQHVQHLKPEDLERRLVYCTWLQNNPQIKEVILYTDEATFTRAGLRNIHNEHWWSEDNPHKTTETNFQHRFSVNVWCGIIDDQLIGPHIFEESLTGEVYSSFLVDDLPALLEDVSLAKRRKMIFQHDGAPPHYSREVRELLNRKFPNQWIGRGGPTPWPARSPDLTPLDFYLWGHMKTLVYQRKSNTKEELRERIMEAAEQIRHSPAVLRKTTQSVLERARCCIDNDGGHFEHLM